MLKTQLKDKEIKAIKLWLQGDMTVQEIADECGYNHRKSIYHILNKEEGKEMLEYLANESVREALSILKGGSKDAAKKLIEIARSGKADTKQLYAQLGAINSILEKSGLNTKNIVLENKENKQEKVSVEELEEMFNEDVDD